jgi:hypothetical protein
MKKCFIQNIVRILLYERTFILLKTYFYYILSLIKFYFKRDKIGFN